MSLSPAQKNGLVNIAQQGGPSATLNGGQSTVQDNPINDLWHGIVNGAGDIGNFIKEDAQSVGRLPGQLLQYAQGKPMTPNPDQSASAERGAWAIGGMKAIPEMGALNGNLGYIGRQAVDEISPALKNTANVIKNDQRGFIGLPSDTPATGLLDAKGNPITKTETPASGSLIKDENGNWTSNPNPSKPVTSQEFTPPPSGFTPEEIAQQKANTPPPVTPKVITNNIPSGKDFWTQQPALTQAEQDALAKTNMNKIYVDSPTTEDFYKKVYTRDLQGTTPEQKFQDLDNASNRLIQDAKTQVKDAPAMNFENDFIPYVDKTLNDAVKSNEISSMQLETIKNGIRRKLFNLNGGEVPTDITPAELLDMHPKASVMAKNAYKNGKLVNFSDPTSMIDLKTSQLTDKAIENALYDKYPQVGADMSKYGAINSDGGLRDILSDKSFRNTNPNMSNWERFNNQSTLQKGTEIAGVGGTIAGGLYGANALGLPLLGAATIAGDKLKENLPAMGKTIRTLAGGVNIGPFNAGGIMDMAGNMLNNGQANANQVNGNNVNSNQNIHSDIINYKPSSVNTYKDVPQKQENVNVNEKLADPSKVTDQYNSPLTISRADYNQQTAQLQAQIDRYKQLNIPVPQSLLQQNNLLQLKWSNSDPNVKGSLANVYQTNNATYGAASDLYKQTNDIAPNFFSQFKNYDSFLKNNDPKYGVLKTSLEILHNYNSAATDGLFSAGNKQNFQQELIKAMQGVGYNYYNMINTQTGNSGQQPTTPPVGNGQQLPPSNNGNLHTLDQNSGNDFKPATYGNL